MRPALFAAAVLLAVNVNSAAAQPNAQRGQEVAQKVCAVCHIPREGAPRLQGTADVPTFAEIARRPQFSAERVANTVMSPPHPMPPVPLTKAEIADVAAYIATLK